MTIAGRAVAVQRTSEHDALLTDSRPGPAVLAVTALSAPGAHLRFVTDVRS